VRAVLQGLFRKRNFRMRCPAPRSENFLKKVSLDSSKTLNEQIIVLSLSAGVNRRKPQYEETPAKR